MEEWLIVFFEMSLINLEYSVISFFLLDNSPNCLFGCVIQLVFDQKIVWLLGV